jgi:glycosyltransferase involved in cell wall biosynthesis
MNPAPLVTVVIPAFNSEPFIRDAIASVRRQTIDDWELIVVDDGSADQTREAAIEAANDDPRIRVIGFDTNRGISAASNVAFDHARGEFIARVDADDIIRPNRLAAQIEAFRKNDRLVVCGSHVGLFGDVPDSVAHCALGDASLKANLLDGLNTISGGTKMVRRAFVHERHIRFNEQLVTAEDLDYLTSIVAAGGELDNVDQVLTEHRMHPGSITKSRVDVARGYLQSARLRLLSLWYPQLLQTDLKHILALFVQPFAPYTDVLIETVRAVDRLILARANDFGQDTAIVHTTVLDRLVKAAAVYRDHNLFDASHVQVIRHFTSPATSSALATLFDA